MVQSASITLSALAHALHKRETSTQVTVFLMADAVERMLKRVLSNKGVVLLCGTCMDARGIGDAELMDGARRSTMDDLATATTEADKVSVF